MKLEQLTESYQRVSKAEKDTLYKGLELYLLGAVEFYTGPCLPMNGGGVSGGGFGGGSIFDRMDHLAGSRPLGQANASRPLTIRDFPASGFQLHIHEGAGGTAHLKTYKGEHLLLSSYDAAMADWGFEYLLKNSKSVYDTK